MIWIANFYSDIYFGNYPFPKAEQYIYFFTLKITMHVLLFLFAVLADVRLLMLERRATARRGI